MRVASLRQPIRTRNVPVRGFSGLKTTAGNLTLRRLVSRLFHFAAWLAALACVPGGALWALTPVGIQLAGQRLPAGSDGFWRLFFASPTLLLLGLVGLWWLGRLGSGLTARLGLIAASVGLAMVIFGNVGQFWLGLDDLFTVTAPAYRAFRIGLVLLALGAVVLGVAAARERALPAWVAAPFVLAALCGLAASLQNLGDLGAGLWSAFGAGWIWLGSSAALSQILTSLDRRSTKKSAP